jgi:hypothetical protein
VSIVLPAWWFVTVATGEPNTTLSLLCAIFAVSWIAGVVVLTQRSLSRSRRSSASVSAGVPKTSAHV